MPTEPRQQLRLAAIVLVAVVAVLTLAYFAFFRVAMVPAYQNIRQSDASAIVVELDKASIPYTLANDGHDILVPEDRAAAARVAVAGSNVAMGGTVGFELFNNSDMGLTEFAQKINFQRAMQGELARTIMMTQGVEFARVHLALPERSIFRANQGTATAAVTIQMRPGHPLTPQRVAGIRQLIASSVPGLAQSAVAVLDENGDLVTPVAAPVTDGAADEHNALDSYYQSRAKDALAGVAPNLTYELTVSARRDVAPLAVDDATSSGRDMPDRERVALTVLVRTETALPSDLQGRIETALVDALALSRDRGDSLRFAVGAIAVDPPLPSPVAPAPQAVASPAAISPPVAGWSQTVSPWLLLGGVALLLAVVAWIMLRPRRRLDDAQARAFADSLQAASFERELADAP